MSKSHARRFGEDLLETLERNPWGIPYKIALKKLHVGASSIVESLLKLFKIGCKRRKVERLRMNAHKHAHKHQSQGRLLSNRGYKYKYVIAPLMSITSKKQKKISGKGLFHAILNDNAIDYVHWDDPNELVDRLLINASHRASNNAQNNEMLSIIEELHETGLIIN
ncbi:hypothetical protein ALC53_04385 [Atta colombica]|uniref:Uncharacterized protein n=1 Tax=Atta colombica TaxID=520822 RepID=A0A195BLS7_9HYME|nr:hypothetical protein ALC53_04385 [Atta colombica]